jgi:hypothetical protein
MQGLLTLLTFLSPFITTQREKVMKEKLNYVNSDSSLFILHFSFCESIAFAPRNLSFDRPKDHVSSPETWSFTR